MKDKELMRSIARAAKRDANEDRLDPRWDDVSRGEMDAPALESATHENDPNVAEAFAPLDQDFRAQLVASATAALGDNDEQETSTNVVPLPTRRKSTWVFALAASALLSVGLATTMLDHNASDGGALPNFTHSFRGTAEVRTPSDTQTTPRVRVDQTFELNLAPQTAYSGQPQVRIYAQLENGEQIITPDNMEVAPTGAIRLQASAASLGVGNTTLIVVISDGSWPPGDQRLKPGAGDAWQVLHIPVEVVPAR